MFSEYFSHITLKIFNFCFFYYFKLRKPSFVPGSANKRTMYAGEACSQLKMSGFYQLIFLADENNNEKRSVNFGSASLLSVFTSVLILKYSKCPKKCSDRH